MFVHFITHQLLKCMQKPHKTVLKRKLPVLMNVIKYVHLINHALLLSYRR